MPFRLLNEEPEKLETEITPQQTPKIGSFRLLEDEPELTQPSQSTYKYDASRFRPKGLTATKSAQEAPEEQSIFRQVADIPLGIARGGVTGIKMMTDILGADNPVSKSLAGVEGYMADLMSAQAKEDQQEISRIMKDAEDKGFGEQVKAGIKAFSIAPVDIMSQALGTMAPVLATGLAGSAAKLGALGIRAVQTGVGAGMGAGMIKGEIYNEVKNELINSGTPEELAEKAAVDAQSYGGKNLDQILLGAGLGAASTLGAERILTRLITKQGVAPSAGIISRTLKGGFTEAIPEGVQAAQEQLAKNVALQREGFDVDPSRGVVAAATMEAIAGAPLGGLAGAIEQPAKVKTKVKTLEEEKFEQTNEIARNVAENGAPLTASALQDKAAANLNQDELAKKLEEELSISAVKPSVAAPVAIPTKDEYVARYSAIAQTAPEELTRAEQSFTNELATADTEEKRINAQNALDAIKEVKAVGITPAAQPVTPVTQPPTIDATQKIIQPEGVRQEPQDRTQVGATTGAGVSDSILDATRSEEERQVARDIVSELQAVANNTATSEQIARLSMEGLVDVRRGQAIINEDGEGILAQAQAPLPTLTPEERAAEVEAAPVTPRPLPTDVLPTETPGAEYGREAELFDVFGGVRRRPVDVAEPIIGEEPQVSPIVGEQVTETTPVEQVATTQIAEEPIISEQPQTSEIVGGKKASIKIKDNIQQKIDPQTGDKISVPVKDFTIETPQKGSAYGYISNNVANIVGIKAPKKEGSVIETERGTKTYPQVIQKLSESGVNTLRVAMPSKDSQIALEKLVLNGTLSNPRDFSGPSDASYPTTWDIVSKQPEEPIISEKPQTSEIVGAETPTIVEQEQVAPSEQPFSETTGDAEIDAKITKTEAMSPDEYLQQAWQATDGKLGVSFEEWLNSNKLTDVDRAKYTQDMKAGDKFPLPYIDKYGGSQDGRNRALAAKEAGIQSIPVGIIEEPSVDVQIQDLREELSSTKSKVGKARIQERINKLETKAPAQATAPAPTSFGQRMLDSINEKLAQGKDVFISTMTKSTKVNKRAVDNWSKAGKPLFKVGKDGNLYIGSGKRYDQLTSADMALVGFSSEGKKLAVAEPVTSAPVTEQAAPAEAPAPEVATAITATPQITQLESEYNAAKSKLDALGEEPRKPSSESKFFGANGRSKADPAVVAKYDADVKAYNSYRRKYSVAKKAEVEAANNLFYARREAAAPTPAVSETITEPVAPTPQVEQEIEVGDEASVDLAGRNETVTIARIEDINGVPTAYFDYFGYKSQPLAEMQLVKKSKQNIARAERKAKDAKVSQIEITPPKPEDFFSNEEITSLVSGKAPDGWKSNTSARDDFFLTDTNGKRWSFKPQYENGEITSILMRAEGQFTGVTITKATAPAVSEAPTPPTQPEGIAVGNRVKLGKSPQTYTIEEAIPQTATEQELGEQYYSVKNERTGEVQVVEAMDLKKVGGKRARKMAAEVIPNQEAVTPIPKANRYTYEEAIRLVDSYFDKEGIPEGVVIVNNTTEPDLEMKAGYFVDRGQIVINLAYIAKGENLSDIISHELGHYIFGDPEFQAEFKKFWDLMTPEEQAEADRLINQFYNEETGAVQMEEKQVRAFMQLIQEGNAQPQWKKILDTIKRWINKYLKTNFQVTDRNALAVLAAAHKRFKSGERIIREIDSGVLKTAETAQDAEYLAAVERGDMETAQRMVDEAAKVAGYDSPKVYHGTDEQFNQFDINKVGSNFGLDTYGFFFTTNKDSANRSRKTYPQKIKFYFTEQDKAAAKSGRIISAYLNLGGVRLNANDIPNFTSEGGVSAINTYDANRENVEKAAKEIGADSFSLRKEGDTFFAVYNPEQIKSADPVTYDDAGNVIPLSQRFRATSPDIRRMAAEPKRERVGGKERGEIITTPEGIIKQTQDVLRNKFFDGTEVSDNATQQAWNYIEQLLDIKSGAANALAGQINDVVDQETNSDSRMGASLFSVSLANYAAKLAAQGDMTMLPYIIRRINRMPVDNLAGGRSEAGEALRAAREYQIDGFNTLKTENKSKVERTAATLFGTSKPSEDQVKIVQDAINAAEDETIGNPDDVATEIEKVEKRTGRKVIKAIEKKVKESTEPKKEELLISFENLDADKKIKGITLKYNPQKVNVAKNIQNFIIGKMVDYRKTLVNQGAGGLESTFWQTMSNLENKPGPLGELDQAQNNELARIVKNTLIKLGLQGEPDNTKMTDIEKVASILNENKLSDEKRLEADQRIVQEIERRRQSDLASGSNPESVNAKYDVILDAWNEAMSRQLNMPISDNMLQRLLKSEIKQRNTQIGELINENDGRVTEQVKNDIVDSIIRRVYGVSKESETGIEMDEDYSNLQSYLKQTINNMYATAIQKKNAAYAKRQAERSLKNNVDAQAQSIINQLSTELSDTPSFSPQIENKVKVIVQQDLRQNPDMGRKQPWTSQLTAKLIDAGVDETQAQTISELTWRQHEIKKMDRDLKELKTAAEKGSLAVIIDRIKTTPLEKQQEPNWMQGVIREYLVDAGLSGNAADTAARLYESVISERLAEAKQKAFETTLNKSAPWNNYLSRNAQLGKNALKRIQDAIRTGVLDSTQNVESIIAKENGWSGFTKEQFQRIVQLDNVISNPESDEVTKAEAMSELNGIIVKAKIPVRFKDAIGAYYVGQALMGIPTVTVNIASPIGFSVRNLITDIGSYAFTEPSRIPMAFETFLDSMKSWYNQTSYAFRNQIYLNDVVEYLNGQNVLRELFDKGKSQWARGEYANGMANMLVGMTQITGRVLSALDQGSISMLENQNITRYAMEAMKQRNIPQSKRKEIANMILDTRRRTYKESIASGMAKDRAGVLADMAVRSELISALAPEGIDFKEVLTSAINDSLQSVGRNKVIDTKGIEAENKRLSDAGMLSYLPIKFLEDIASGASSGNPLMQVFSKMLYGFALVPARVFHTTAWYSPYGFIRLGIDKYKKNKGEESPYAMSLQTDLQYKQRLTESIAGSIVMLGLAALAGSSTDDEEEKKFRIVITGNGPSYSADRQYFDSWNKKWKPYSIHIVMGDTIIPINIGRGGEALFFPIMLAGALDDWNIKKKLNLTKKSPEDLNFAVEALGSAFFALAQRGPYAAFTKPLFDASKEGKITEELVGQAGFFGKTFVPILGASVARNISDFINDPVDRSSLEGAIYANTPVIGPWMGAKALNALGQPVRADDWGDKLYKLGAPVVFSFPKNTPENELNELILKKGSGPSIPTRSNAQKRFGDVMTDKEFETYVREYGRVVSDKMFKNRKKLENMSVKNYDDELQRYVTGYSIDGIKITGASDMAVRAVKKMRTQ
jgi:hypothetical protein